MVDAVPPLRGRPGPPVRKPGLLQGDRAYDSQPHRDVLHRRGIRTQLAKRRTDHGSGLGRTRWVVERTLAWLHRFRRLAVRYERRVLQIPADRHRHHYVKCKVRVHEYPDGRLAVFHGPRCLARYQADGALADASGLVA